MRNHGRNLPNGDASIRRQKDDETVKDLEIDRLKHEVEELQEIIAEAKANPRPQKLTQFGDLILYLLIVIIISFIMIGLALISLMICFNFINSCAFIDPVN